jgi:tetrahydromethanopterin S-methyltransferase subunit G
MSKGLYEHVFSPRNAANILVRYALLPLETYCVITQIETALPKKTFYEVGSDVYFDTTLITIIIVQQLLNNILDFINSRKSRIIGENPSKNWQIAYGIVITLYSIAVFYPVKNYLRWNQVDASIGCTPVTNGLCIPHKRQYPIAGFFFFPISELFKGLPALLTIYIFMEFFVKKYLPFMILPAELKAKVTKKEPLTKTEQFIVEYFAPLFIIAVFYPFDTLQKRTRYFGSLNHTWGGFFGVEGVPHLMLELGLSKFAHNRLNEIPLFKKN